MVRNSSLTLDVQGNDFACNVLYASIDEECLPADACYNDITWTIELGTSTQVFTNQGPNFTFPIPSPGYNNSYLFAMATINLVDGNTCDVRGRVLLDCAKEKGERRNSMVNTGEPAKQIHIFPNPAKSEISVNNPFNNQVVARIFNTNGQQLLSTVLRSNATQALQLIDFNPGVYFVQFIDQISNEQLSTEKLILLK